MFHLIILKGQKIYFKNVVDFVKLTWYIERMRQKSRRIKRRYIIENPSIGKPTPQTEVELIFAEAQMKIGLAGNHWTGYKSEDSDIEDNEWY